MVGPDDATDLVLQQFRQTPAQTDAEHDSLLRALCKAHPEGDRRWSYIETAFRQCAMRPRSRAWLQRRSRKLSETETADTLRTPPAGIGTTSSKSLTSAGRSPGDDRNRSAPMGMESLFRALHGMVSGQLLPDDEELPFGDGQINECVLVAYMRLKSAVKFPPGINVDKAMLASFLDNVGKAGDAELVFQALAMRLKESLRPMIDGHMKRWAWQLVGGLENDDSYMQCFGLMREGIVRHLQWEQEKLRMFCVPGRRVLLPCTVCPNENCIPLYERDGLMTFFKRFSARVLHDVLVWDRKSGLVRVQSPEHGVGEYVLYPPPLPSACAAPVQEGKTIPECVHRAYVSWLTSDVLATVGLHDAGSMGNWHILLQWELDLISSIEVLDDKINISVAAGCDIQPWIERFVDTDIEPFLRWPGVDVDRRLLRFAAFCWLASWAGVFSLDYADTLGDGWVYRFGSAKRDDPDSHLKAQFSGSSAPRVEESHIAATVCDLQAKGSSGSKDKCHSIAVGASVVVRRPNVHSEYSNGKSGVRSGMQGEVVGAYGSRWLVKFSNLHHVCAMEGENLDVAQQVPREEVCNACGRHGRFVCKGCAIVRYCGQDCQARDWHSHAKICTFLKDGWMKLDTEADLCRRAMGNFNVGQAQSTPALFDCRSEETWRLVKDEMGRNDAWQTRTRQAVVNDGEHADAFQSQYSKLKRALSLRQKAEDYFGEAWACHGAAEFPRVAAVVSELGHLASELHSWQTHPAVHVLPSAAQSLSAAVYLEMKAFEDAEQDASVAIQQIQELLLSTVLPSRYRAEAIELLAETFIRHGRALLALQRQHDAQKAVVLARSYKANVCLHELARMPPLRGVEDIDPSEIGKCSLCSELVPKQQMKSHKKRSCLERQVPCPQCGAKIRASQLEGHFADDCPNALQPCDLCEEMIPRQQLDDHRRLECNLRPAACPHTGCAWEECAYLLPAHMRQCAFSTETCPSCLEEMCARDMPSHVCPIVPADHSCICCTERFSDLAKEQLCPAILMFDHRRSCPHMQMCIGCAVRLKESLSWAESQLGKSQLGSFNLAATNLTGCQINAKRFWHFPN